MLSRYAKLNYTPYVDRLFVGVGVQVQVLWAVLYRYVFRLFLKLPTVTQSLTDTGRLFHSFGAAWLKDLDEVLSFVVVTLSRPVAPSAQCRRSLAA